MHCLQLPCILSPLAFTIFSFFTIKAHIWYSFQDSTLAIVTNSFSITHFGKKWGQCILVCIIGCCFEDGRINFLARVRDFFLFTKVSTPSSGARPTSYSLHTRSCFRGVKRPGRKAYHSPPPNSGIKNAWLNLHSPIHLHVFVRNEIQGHPIAFSVTRLCTYVWGPGGGVAWMFVAAIQ